MEEEPGSSTSLNSHPSERVITNLSTESACSPAKSIYSSSRGGQYSMIIPPPSSHRPVRSAESEKFREIRRRKELKKMRGIRKVFEYETSYSSYNFDAVLESFGETLNNGCSAANNNNNGKKDKKVRRVITRHRSNNKYNKRKTDGIATCPSSLEGDRETSKNFEKDEEEEEEEDEDEDEDKMSSSSLVGGNFRENDDDIFSKFSIMERSLSKSSENLSNYSFENCNSFIKVTNKKQKWKKKNAHSVEIPDKNQYQQSQSQPHQRSPPQHGYNGYNLRNREVASADPPRPSNPDLDLNARDFPPLDTPVDDSSSSNASPTWSKPPPSSSVSSSSSSVITMNDRQEGEGEESPSSCVCIDLPDVTRQPPSINSNSSNNHLPDLTAHAVVAAAASSSGVVTPEESEEYISKVGDVAIALTEEEYQRQDRSTPVVIFGRGSSAIKDWTSKVDTVEFGFEVNESLLAMSNSSQHNPPPPPPPEKAERLPLDRIDGAILSFGDSVTNLAALGNETLVESSSGAPLDEETITFNYNEVISYLENAWIDTIKDLKQHQTVSAAY